AAGGGPTPPRPHVGDTEIGLDADEPVVLASVFKIPVVLEHVRQAASGTLERTECSPAPQGRRRAGRAAFIATDHLKE
ncbi:hypothetical protein ABT130_46525, partial [Streptosporangium sp. NPDC001681]